MKYRALLILGLTLVSTHIFAKKFQILHTNDIHSHLEHADHMEGRGGYARLKTLVDEQKRLAQSRGISNLTMDAGDFLEGHIFYLADKGRKVFEVHDQIGYDAVTIGNHDYLMGSDDLDAILGDVKPNFSFLGANFYTNKKFTNIAEQIKPYTEFEFDGVKVGVVGITTNDILYKWRINGGGISNEYAACKKYSKELRQRGNHIVIALTHMGFSKDKKLAKKCPELDLIVGGHSHTVLHKVFYQKSKKGKLIPIVQAGNHARWLGRLIFNYNEQTKKIEIENYKLLPVVAEEDPEMLEMISGASHSVEEEYGEDWLNTILGHSQLKSRFEGGNRHIWGHFINDAMREQTDSDFSIHVEPLSGLNYPVERFVTRKDLYNGNPRTFEFENKFGYNVYTARIRGGFIKLLFKVVMRTGLPLYVSGVTFDVKKYSKNGKIIKNMRLNGRRINPFKYYKISFSEAIVRGAYSITNLTKLILKGGKDTRISMWEALENKMKRIQVIDETYLDDYGRKGNFQKIERGYIPGNDND
ncbi:bifunctional UDP-sugar hydrolase/5'-nucleotidase [Halobacteriovorax sp. HLS]|uniref:bifunctional metallophosphatase/5'-nucleotidase n=1 Tax=Halobacteriovorax sp. HLS TaxID=2234000 RepID=UPI000FD7E66B|nr:bifunctional UDP-sugar hydrolase/5'-nucleotidase [Halobacteriovorax sp. HLS]